ncbi:unnamed protein product [Ceratitis capitata]|uniref:(Mediterranean fruit fly) hypothetical protein n=1 Tax=Ceratitis capitata TaxID=7213 RepID=A0A811V6P5_CERCA|nr:unnamed protein product [Ceratitis capitata]
MGLMPLTMPPTETPSTPTPPPSMTVIAINATPNAFDISTNAEKYASQNALPSHGNINMCVQNATCYVAAHV